MGDDIDVQLAGRRGSFTLDVRFRVPSAGVTALFGSSGAGKTSVLRATAGLERFEGTLRFRDATWQDRASFVPPEQRRVGYVFQEAALFPHLTVHENLAYAMRRARGSRRVPLEAAIEWLGVSETLGRRPATLSGGERQRVAIARALVSNPLLLLMDEPLAALDLGARSEILKHLVRLRRELDVPILYVTHAIEEVARLADRVVWVEQGRVRSLGTPGEVFARLDGGQSLGDDASGLIVAVVRGHDEYELTELDSAWGRLFVARMDAAPGERVQLRIRAADVSIGLEPDPKSSILNVLAADVEETRETSPGQVLVRLTCPVDPSLALLARITRRSAAELAIARGSRVFARVKSVSVR
jgi:molybdate transport system ATP-binding protein